MQTMQEGLDTVPMFKALSKDQLTELVTTAERVHLKQDDVLFRMDDVSSRFFYLVSGKIKISRSSPQGAEKILLIVQSGQLFAEAVMFLKRNQYPATARAIQPSEVLGFKSSVFRQYLQTTPDLAMTMLGNLSAKLHSQIIEIDNLTLQNANFRLLNYIDSLIDDDATQPIYIELPVPKNVIASRLSITPETLSRSLHNLDELNIVKSPGRSRSIAIPCLSAFKQFLLTQSTH